VVEYWRFIGGFQTALTKQVNEIPVYLCTSSDKWVETTIFFIVIFKIWNSASAVSHNACTTNTNHVKKLRR